MGELVPFSSRSPDPAPPSRTGSPFLTMFCAGCGADRTVPPSAADPGPCPKCGSTLRTSCRPGENGYPTGLSFRLTAANGVVDPLELVSDDGAVSYFPPAGGAA